MRRLMVLALMLLMAICLTGVSAQEDGLPVVEDAVSLLDIIDGPPNTMAVLAPDGSALAYPTADSLCLYAPATAETTCTELTDFSSRVTGLVWSPDSAYLAFTENLFVFLHESDVWVMEVGAGTVSNLTDDGVADNYFSLEDPVPLDSMPFWGPDGTLYFLRSMSDAELAEDDATLMRIDPAGGEAQEVMRLAAVPLFSVFELNSARALNGPLVLSPDGSLLAVNRIGRERLDPDNGVWVFDMTGADAPRHIVSSIELQTVGMPSYRIEETADNVSMWPYGLAWALDGTALIVSALDGQFTTSPPAYMTYFINVASGAITPLIDFSGVPERIDFYNTASVLTPGDIRLFDVPLAAAVTPDGKRVIMGHGIRGTTTAGLTISSLPPRTDVLPQVFNSREEPGLFILNRSVMSADGRYLLVGGTLYTLGTE